ncbi:16785_t:CDS:1, partial [Gigaspora margarita]
ETNNLIEYDLTDYGSLIDVQQFEDEKILIATTNGSTYLLYFIYQNGSIIPVNYEHPESNLYFVGFKPLATNHVLMIYENTVFIYENAIYPSTKSTLLGIIINLNSPSKIT